jgi:hypothetical protein
MTGEQIEFLLGIYFLVTAFDRPLGPGYLKGVWDSKAFRILAAAVLLVLSVTLHYSPV